MLTEGTREIRNATSMRTFALSKSAGALLGAVIITFANCWRSGLVTLACVPLLVCSGLARMRVGRLSTHHRDYVHSEAFASDSIRNIGAVLALGRVAYFSDA
jgi:hypothetical protein